MQPNWPSHGCWAMKKSQGVGVPLHTHMGATAAPLIDESPELTAVVEDKVVEPVVVRVVAVEPVV